MKEIWTNEGEGRRIVIEPSLWTDDSPRAACDGKGRLICAPHPKYPRFADETVTPERLDEIAAEAEARGADVRIVSMYEHGGVAVRLGPPTDRWDSGEIGIYVVEKPGDGSPVDDAALTRAIERELRIVSAWLNNEAFDAVEERRGTADPPAARRNGRRSPRDGWARSTATTTPSPACSRRRGWTPTTKRGHKRKRSEAADPPDRRRDPSTAIRCTRAQDRRARSGPMRPTEITEGRFIDRLLRLPRAGDNPPCGPLASNGYPSRIRATSVGLKAAAAARIAARSAAMNECA